jgi:ABC-2 type transport system ATP-binding protein
VATLAAESGRLDHRVVTSDPATTRRVVAATPGLELVPALGAASGDRDVDRDRDVVVARGPVGAVEQLVVRLVAAGVAVRELGPVVPPLEAAFLALTGAVDALTAEEEAR